MSLIEKGTELICISNLEDFPGKQTENEEMERKNTFRIAIDDDGKKGFVGFMQLFSRV